MSFININYIFQLKHPPSLSHVSEFGEFVQQTPFRTTIIFDSDLFRIFGTTSWFFPDQPKSTGRNIMDQKISLWFIHTTCRTAECRSARPCELKPPDPKPACRNPIWNGYWVFLWQHFLWFFSLKCSADTSGEYVKVSFLLKLLCFRPSLANLFSRTLFGRLFSFCLPVGFCLPLSVLWTCAVIRSGLVTERTGNAFITGKILWSLWCCCR